MDAPLLHLVTPNIWREALAVGAVRPSVAEFVHLSNAEQVAIPANRLYPGRDDVYLLVLDPGRVGVEVRWEPGEPSDAAGLMFPHAYGPIPTAAVLAVVPYRPGPDGVFTDPVLPDMAAPWRATAQPISVLRRTATAEEPVEGGVAIHTEPVPFSYRHNSLLLDDPVDAPTVAAEAARTSAGLGRPAAQLLGDAFAPTAAALAALGWQVGEQVAMVARPAAAPNGRVEQLDLAAVRPLWDAEWRRDLPQASDEARGQLCDRYALEAAVVDLRYLAVREEGAVVAAALLKIDGATAELDAVGTDPEHRGRGHGDALVAEALALAAAAGCDVVGLDADAEDWPRRWYARRGFTAVRRSWFATGPTP